MRDGCHEARPARTSTAAARLTIMLWRSPGARAPSTHDVESSRYTDTPVLTRADEIVGRRKVRDNDLVHRPRRGWGHDSAQAAILHQHATAAADHAIAQAVQGTEGGTP